jgi:hypothetical protein
MLYDILVALFGIGVWMSAGENRALRATSILLVLYGLVGLPGPWFFPMNLRGTGTLRGDLPHVVLTGLLMIVVLAFMATGAFAFGRRFRRFSFAAIVVMLT